MKEEGGKALFFFFFREGLRSYFRTLGFVILRLNDSLFIETASNAQQKSIFDRLIIWEKVSGVQAEIFFINKNKRKGGQDSSYGERCSQKNLSLEVGLSMG